MTTFELLDAVGVVAEALATHDKVTHVERLADNRYVFEFGTVDGRTVVAETIVYIVDVDAADR